MLSKSQARQFFVIGTVFFSGIFVWLTIDTAMKVPAQTKQQNLTEGVERGKKIWEKNNCMGCHTLMGEGAYYAPELTKAYERRGPEWLKIFLKDPQAMYPNDRKMVNYHFNDDEIADVIEFLKWIGEMDLNGYPKKPDLVAPVTTSAGIIPTGELAIARPVKYDQLCSACHSIGGAGGNVGPALDGIGGRFDAEFLHNWIKDPASIKPGSTMPKLPLADEDLEQIVAYLMQLK
jgi:nitric oxide reductase subunit C